MPTSAIEGVAVGNGVGVPVGAMVTREERGGFCVNVLVGVTTTGEGVAEILLETEIGNEDR